jgi:transcriptional regulator of acetoin/glycerol metabolism
VHPQLSGHLSNDLTNTQLVIVRRGQFATFGQLAKALTNEPKVRIIWDRRFQDRRRGSDASRGVDRRGPDRRRDASTVWARHDYLVLGTTGFELTAGAAPPALSQDRVAAFAALQTARDLDQDVEAAAQTDINILITGGDQVRRKLLAEQVHVRSLRGTSPLAIVDRRLAAELFSGPELTGSPLEIIGGVERLAVFLGSRTWLIEEIGDLSWQQQTGLLRFLERRDHASSAQDEFSPRFISATDCWLFDRVAASQFHPDLFYRLNMIHIVLPVAGALDQKGQPIEL